jgi:hypothetical protein
MKPFFYSIIIITFFLSINGCTRTLSEATMSGNIGSIQKSLARGDSIESEAPYSFGHFPTEHYEWMTPLIYSAVEGRTDVVKYLIDNGANVNHCESMFGMNALMYTLWMYNGKVRMKEMCQLLIEKGIDINAKDRSGNTALMIAAYKGYDGIIEELLQGGGDMKKENYLGWTSLACAALGDLKMKNKSTAELLLRNGGHLPSEYSILICPEPLKMKIDDRDYEMDFSVRGNRLGTIFYFKPGTHDFNVSIFLDMGSYSLSGDIKGVLINVEKGRIIYIKYKIDETFINNKWLVWIEKYM